MEEARGEGEEEQGGGGVGQGRRAKRVDVACGMERMRQIMIKKNCILIWKHFFCVCSA